MGWFENRFWADANLQKRRNRSERVACLVTFARSTKLFGGVIKGGIMTGKNTCSTSQMPELRGKIRRGERVSTRKNKGEQTVRLFDCRQSSESAQRVVWKLPGFLFTTVHNNSPTGPETVVVGALKLGNNNNRPTTERR